MVEVVSKLAADVLGILWWAHTVPKANPHGDWVLDHAEVDEMGVLALGVEVVFDVDLESVSIDILSPMVKDLDWGVWIWVESMHSGTESVRVVADELKFLSPDLLSWTSKDEDIVLSQELKDILVEDAISLDVANHATWGLEADDVGVLAVLIWLL